MDRIITYYLEMTAASDLNEVRQSNGLAVIEAEIDNFRFNRFLYRYIGEPWKWTDKLRLSDDQWQQYVQNPDLRTWVAYFKGSIAGYFELLKTDNDEVQIAYFGLAADFIGRGFGGYLLSRAVKLAWAIPGTKRVWVHTCSLDHPNALSNYLARGFRLFKQE